MLLIALQEIVQKSCCKSLIKQYFRAMPLDFLIDSVGFLTVGY